MPNTLDHLLEEAHSKPLSATIPKVLRAAQSVGDQELATWARLELLGYFASNPAMTHGIVVPEYRSVIGQWFDAYGRPFLITDPKLLFINETRVREGVGELESFMQQTGVLAINNPDVSSFLEEKLGVSVSAFRFTQGSVEKVLAGIRSQLVHRLLEHGDRLNDRAGLSNRNEVGMADVWQIKPSIYGVGIDLRAAWRWVRNRWRLS